MGNISSKVRGAFSGFYEDKEEKWEDERSAGNRWNRSYGASINVSVGTENLAVLSQESHPSPETRCIESNSDGHTKDKEHSAVCREGNEPSLDSVDNRWNSMPQGTCASLDGSPLNQHDSTKEERQEVLSSTLSSSSKTCCHDVDGACYHDIEEIIRHDEQEGRIPAVDDNGLRVLILHVDEDVEVADELADVLRRKYGCRVPHRIKDVIFRMYGGGGLTGAQNWADAILIILSDDWSNAIRSLELGERENTERYNYLFIQKQWMNDGGINRKIVPVLRPGTNPYCHRDFPEIRKPITLEECIESFDEDVRRLIELGRILANNRTFHRRQPK